VQCANGGGTVGFDRVRDADETAGWPSRAMNIGVLPCAARVAAGSSRSPVGMAASVSSRALPMSSCWSSTVASTPLPVIESKVVG
jgi:hypothetical protein